MPRAGQRAESWRRHASRLPRLVAAEPRNVVFTSGGTEANMLALTPALEAGRLPRERLLVSAIEHPSVLAGGRFPRNVVDQLPVTDRGAIDLCALERRLTEIAGLRVLVSLMLANNETGVVQPVSEAARLVHQRAGSCTSMRFRVLGEFPAISATLQPTF